MTFTCLFSVIQAIRSRCRYLTWSSLRTSLDILQVSTQTLRVSAAYSQSQKQLNYLIDEDQRTKADRTMGLPPLEYIDCFLDSPNFREIITLYEKELESNSQYVKSLVKECRNMISATEGERELSCSVARSKGFAYNSRSSKTKALLCMGVGCLACMWGRKTFRFALLSL